MRVIQETFTLPAFQRGFHLVTEKITRAIPELSTIKKGVAHIFIHHTSAGLTINENADPTVRSDFESHFNKMVPENAPYYKHTLEGPDDMPAHIKSSLLGSSVSVPVTNGSFNMGTWQGVYLCEHRDHASGRTITITITGE
ncbi:secondary thiamine-phosphate synthase enzyme YjbQ [Cytophagaceae bacterium ABcell3]|nr:secondary thiamine-phosphate synthase enzyme YjbQ [Cytophagaceae bacterium ABcell3]